MLRDVAEWVGVVLIVILGLAIAAAMLVAVVEIVKGIVLSIRDRRRETPIIRAGERD